MIIRRPIGKGTLTGTVSFSNDQEWDDCGSYYTPSGRSIQKPYNNGFEEYYYDLNMRFERRQFEVPDSIHFPDSL